MIIVFVSVVLMNIAQSSVVDPRRENMLNVHSNWRESIDSKECNIYDEAHYCQQLIIDDRQTLIAVSQKCACPEGYRCPNDTSDTELTTQCDYEFVRRWHKCKLRCAPIDI